MTVTLIQRKWKSIRSCYTRELLRVKGIKSGSAATRKKQYTYFEQLRFLDTAVKKSTTNVNEEDVNEDETKTSVSSDNGPTCRVSQKKSKKRFCDDDELIQVLKTKIATEEKSRTFDDTDEDKLFLLSMLTEIHKVPASNKLKLRADMISLIAAAQIPVGLQHGWQQMGYAGPSNPMPPPPPVLQYPLQRQPTPIQHMQQRPMEQYPMQQQLMSQSGLIDHHFVQTQFGHRQDSNLPLQSPASADTSVTSNEEDSDSQMSEPLLFSM